MRSFICFLSCLNEPSPFVFRNRYSAASRLANPDGLEVIAFPRNTVSGAYDAERGMCARRSNRSSQSNGQRLDSSPLKMGGPLVPSANTSAKKTSPDIDEPLHGHNRSRSGPVSERSAVRLIAARPGHFVCSKSNF